MRSAGMESDAFSATFYRRPASLPSQACCAGSCQIRDESAWFLNKPLMG